MHRNARVTCRVVRRSSVKAVTPAPPTTTVGELRASGHQQKTLRHEIRDNLLAALREGRDPWPGLHGFEDTVIPQLERALIAGHDVVLLGERGQGKTRLLRTLVGLLDEWTPVIEGSELGEHPFEPITPVSRRRAEELGDELPVAWRHRDERYAEKLATPDTSVADLIGDVDPMKVAEGRSLGDPETIHFGLIPRSHRGIVAINELPDLAERIQVAMLNVMEERDIQIRGYVLRLPLDVLVVASANPEDYTNRGRIITPLKDRFGAEIRTHYPTELDDEVRVIRQEAHLAADVPDHLVEILARFTRALRESSAVDQRSGVSARFAIAGAETIAAAALHRATVQGEAEPVARVVDLETAVDVLGGKIEFESGEEGREREVLTHLLRTATAETVRQHFRGLDFAVLVDALESGIMITTGEQVTARDFLTGLPVLGESELYDDVCDRLGAGERRPAGRRHRAGPRGALPRPQGQQGVRRRRDRLWLGDVRGHGSRYGRYDGGPDPLAPPVDLAEALDAIGEDVMAGYSPERAMQEFLRRGGRDQAGLDDLARRVAERRRDLLQRHHLDGTLQEVRELLDHAVLEERKQLARDVTMDDGDRALREMQLENLPPSPAAAVSELASYDWQSREAREDYEKIKDLLGREMLDQRFAGMKQALENATDEDRAAINEMLQDLNELLDKHRRGEDTQADFDEFMDKHGDFFPENPRDHRRAARRARPAGGRRPADAQLDDPGAARRARRPRRAGLRQPRADAVAGPARRQPAGAAPGRGLGRLRAVRGRARGWASATAPASSRTSPTSTSSPSSSRSRTAAPGWTTSTSTSWRASSATRRPSTPAPSSGSSRRCATAAPSSAAPTASCGSRPKAMRQLGKSLLRDVADRMSGRQGQRDLRRAGAAGELSGATREWAFGDTEPWDVTRTVHNAVVRTVAEGGSTADGVRLRIEDVEVQETEARTQAAWRCSSTRRSRWRWTAAGCR